MFRNARYAKPLQSRTPARILPLMGSLGTARVGFSQCAKHRHYRIALEFGAMRARIAYERLNELQRRRLLRRTIVHIKETHHIASLPYYGWSQSDAREQTRIREPL